MKLIFRYIAKSGVFIIWPLSTCLWAYAQAAELPATAPCALDTRDSYSPAPQPAVTLDSDTREGLGSAQANAPLRGNISAIEASIGKEPVVKGPYTGVHVQIHNGSDSPLLLDGDRASIRINQTVITAANSDAIARTACPQPSKGHEAKVALGAALTVGASLAVHDAIVEHGPVLDRFGLPQCRRELDEQRFGKRIIWGGDSTDGVIFFEVNPAALPGSGTIKLPIVTFPDFEIRGYLEIPLAGLVRSVRTESKSIQRGRL